MYCDSSHLFLPHALNCIIFIFVKKKKSLTFRLHTIQNLKVSNSRNETKLERFHYPRSYLRCHLMLTGLGQERNSEALPHTREQTPKPRNRLLATHRSEPPLFDKDEAARPLCGEESFSNGVLGSPGARNRARHPVSHSPPDVEAPAFYHPMILTWAILHTSPRRTRNIPKGAGFATICLPETVTLASTDSSAFNSFYLDALDASWART